MVIVYSKSCSHSGITKQASCGVTSDTNVEFCREHATVGMMLQEVQPPRRLFRAPAFGVTGSNKPEFCRQHATEGMVKFKAKRCVLRSGREPKTLSSVAKVFQGEDGECCEEQVARRARGYSPSGSSRRVSKHPRQPRNVLSVPATVTEEAAPSDISASYYVYVPGTSYYDEQHMHATHRQDRVSFQRYRRSFFWCASPCVDDGHKGPVQATGR